MSQTSSPCSASLFIKQSSGNLAERTAYMDYRCRHRTQVSGPLGGSGYYKLINWHSHYHVASHRACLPGKEHAGKRPQCLAALAVQALIQTHERRLKRWAMETCSGTKKELSGPLRLGPDSEQRQLFLSPAKHNHLVVTSCLNA